MPPTNERVQLAWQAHATRLGATGATAGPATPPAADTTRDQIIARLRAAGYLTDDDTDDSAILSAVDKVAAAAASARADNELYAFLYPDHHIKET